MIYSWGTRWTQQKLVHGEENGLSKHIDKFIYLKHSNYFNE